MTTSRRDLLLAGAGMSGSLLWSAGVLSQPFRNPFRRTLQYIAALAPPDARSGDNAAEWGLWPLDPGPRGVQLDDYEKLVRAGGHAPAGWDLDDGDWWLEEHGLIMEAPQFPLPPGRYSVTGDREVEAILTIQAPGADGKQQWSLDQGADVYDVTHLRCRSGRYTPATDRGICSPGSADQRHFPVKPGAVMPDVPGCHRQDYAVLIVTGIDSL